MSGWAVAIILLPTYGFAFFRNAPFVPSTPRSFSLATRLSTAKASPGDVATIDLSIMLEDGTAMPADFDTGICLANIDVWSFMVYILLKPLGA